MEKEKLWQVDGEVMELLPSATFRVVLESDIKEIKGKEIIAYVSGRMRKNNIRISKGDRIKVEMSSYDLTQGRVIHRY